jgi:hypothetical protein
LPGSFAARPGQAKGVAAVLYQAVETAIEAYLKAVEGN